MKEQSDKFNIGLLRLKKIIARFYHYYTQLAETGDELAGNEEEFFWMILWNFLKCILKR